MTPDIEARERFVKEMTRLYLWYVRALLARREIAPEGVPQALASRVNLYRMTSLWDGAREPRTGLVDPEWERLASRLAELVRRSPPDDTSALEEEGLALLWPLLEERLPRDVGTPTPHAFGCWRYNLAWEGVGDRPGAFVTIRSLTHVLQRARRALGLAPAPRRDAELHFDNVLRPGSPFDDLPTLARSLGELVADCRGRYPHVRRLWCHSWLNSHPVFLSLFPASYRRDPILRPPGNMSSWWGQFMTRTGDFHRERAAKFRATGEFPFLAYLCRAPVEEMEAHLAGATFSPGPQGTQAT